MSAAGWSVEVIWASPNASGTVSYTRRHYASVTDRDTAIAEVATEFDPNRCSDDGPWCVEEVRVEEYSG